MTFKLVNQFNKIKDLRNIIYKININCQSA